MKSINISIWIIIVDFLKTNFTFNIINMVLNIFFTAQEYLQSNQGNETGRDRLYVMFSLEYVLKILKIL